MSNDRIITNLNALHQFQLAKHGSFKMATQLSGEEFEAARNNFKEIDKDADGKITREELKLYCVTQNEIRTETTNARL